MSCKNAKNMSCWAVKGSKWSIQRPISAVSSWVGLHQMEWDRELVVLESKSMSVLLKQTDLWPMANDQWSLCQLKQCSSLHFLLIPSSEERPTCPVPTLPQAIQLFQVETMNKLRQTIWDEESVIAEQEVKIADLEIAVVSLEEAIDLFKNKGIT